MVGGLVQKKPIGLGDESAAQKGSSLLAAGQGLEPCFRLKPHQRNLPLNGVMVGSVVGHPGGDDLFDRVGEAGRDLLRKHRDSCTRLEHDSAAIGHNHARNDAEQRGLAFAISTHEPDALTPFDLEGRVVQKRSPAERDGEILEADQ